MRSQDSAHSRHASAHAAIISSSPNVRQSASHARQISAQVPHTLLWFPECRSRNSALVAQIRAQSSIRSTCFGSAWPPPFSRQCASVCEHSLKQCRHFSAHARISDSVISIFASPSTVNENQPIAAALIAPLFTGRKIAGVANVSGGAVDPRLHDWPAILGAPPPASASPLHRRFYSA